MILLLYYSFYFVEPKNFPFFKWQYRAGAGAKIMEKGELELEPKLNNFVSTTRIKTIYLEIVCDYAVSIVL